MSVMTDFKVNYSEAGGTPLGNMFNLDLGKGLHCERDCCPPCGTSEEGKRATVNPEVYCMQHNAHYVIQPANQKIITMRMSSPQEADPGLGST